MVMQNATGVNRSAFANAALIALEERIAELSRWERGFYRREPWKSWTDIRAENRLLLRELFRLRRHARRSVEVESMSLAAGDFYAYPRTVQRDVFACSGCGDPEAASVTVIGDRTLCGTCVQQHSADLAAVR